ncbi:MAG: hypothetical protein QXG00_08220 [Candidatus Woesearchaeota archaeon]
MSFLKYLTELMRSPMPEMPEDSDKDYKTIEEIEIPNPYIDVCNNILDQIANNKVSIDNVIPPSDPNERRKFEIAKQILKDWGAVHGDQEDREYARRNIPISAKVELDLSTYPEYYGDSIISDFKLYYGDNENMWIDEKDISPETKKIIQNIISKFEDKYLNDLIKKSKEDYYSSL